MGACAIPAGQPSIRDISNQRVLEGVLRLTVDARPGLSAQELLSDRALHEPVRLFAVEIEQMCDGARPHHLADHRGPLQRLLLVVRQRIQAR